MIRRNHLAVVLLLLAACAPASLHGPTTPSHDATAHSASGAEARDAEHEKARVTVLSYRDTVTVSDDGTVVHRLERRYRIDDKAALQSDWTSTGASWSPWRHARPTIEVSVVSKDGSVHHLDPATIEESAAHQGDASMYSDQRVLRAPIPNLDVGALVTEVITTRTTRPLAPKAAGGLEAVGDWLGAEATEITLDVPESMPLAWKLFGDQATATESRAGGRRKVTVTRPAYLAPTKVYEGVPDDVWQAPHLLWGTATSWASLAAYYATVSDGALAGAGLTATARSLIAPGDDVATQTRKLTSYVREHVRYVGLELGQSAIVPHTPTETLSRKYGDCKDQALLLVGLLRAVGIDASVALVTTGRLITPTVPMLEVFDHAIVHVEGKTPLWIDPTDVGEPGVVSPDLEGHYALLARGETTALVVVPESVASANVYKETREIYLPSEGAARLVETSSGQGQVDRGLRGEYSDPSALSRDAATKYVEKSYGAKKLGDYGATKADDLFRPLEDHYEAIDTPRGFSNDTLSEVVIEDDVLYGSLQQDLFTDDTRPYGVKLGYAETRTLEVIVHSAAPFEAEDAPAGETVTMGPVTLTRAFEKRGPHELRARFTLVMPSRHFSLDEVKALRTALADYVKRPRARLQFPRRAATLEAAGKSVEALALLRGDLAAKDATYVDGRRLVTFLLHLRLIDEARRTAESLVQRFTDSGHPLELLAVTLFCDRLGRTRGVDVDYHAALPLLERAHAKDPESIPFRETLAEAVRTDPWGRPTFDRPAVDRAVALLSDAKSEQTAADAQGVAFLLARSGRYTAALPYVAKITDAASRESFELVVAATSGKGDALPAAIARLAGGDKEHEDALKRAANAGVAIGAYGAAFALREAYDKRVAATSAKQEPDEMLATMRAMRDGLPGEAALERQLDEQICDLAALDATGRRRDGSTTVTDVDAMVKTSVHSTLGDMSDLAYSAGLQVTCDLTRASVRPKKVRDVGALAEVRLETYPNSKLLLTLLVAPNAAKEPILLASSLGERSAAKVVRGELAQAGEGRARKMLEWFFSFRESAGGIPTSTPGVAVWNTTHDVRLTLDAMDPEGDAGAVAALLKARRTNEDRAFQIAIDSAIYGTVYYRAIDELGPALDRLEGLGSPPPSVRFARLRWLGQRGARADIEHVLANPQIPTASRANGYLAAAEGYHRSGKVSDALDMFERANAITPLSGGDANNALWNAVLADRADLPWLKDVAASLASSTDWSHLHTLASYYAAIGEVPKAIAFVDAFVAKWGVRKTRPSLYLPIALLAEKHGLRASAIELLSPMAADSDDQTLRAFAKKRIAKLKALPGSEPTLPSAR